jgi:dipeptidyl-peptidase-4
MLIFAPEEKTPMFSRSPFTGAALGLAAAALAFQSPLNAQDRLKSMPGYAQYERMSREIAGAITLGSITPQWKADSSSFEYAFDGKRYRFDVAARRAVVIGDAPEGNGGRGGREAGQAAGQRGRGRGEGQQAPARGRQFDTADSPDQSLRAVYRNRNIWLGKADGSEQSALTTDGTDQNRRKYGTASWVYGEELGQRTAMWWSPDSHKLAYYRFDEKQVPDYYLQMHQTDIQDALDVEAYPKPGKPNPVVDIFVYDVPAKKTVLLDIRDGKPFENVTVGYYVWGVEWSQDGRELLMYRANRVQNTVELAACAPETGKCRTIVRESSSTGWVAEGRDRRFLKDGTRFIWSSERNGWKNYYLYDLKGKLIAPLTTATAYEASSIVSVDESTNTMFYLARDGENFMKMQLHSVGLDGTRDHRLTDPAFGHTVYASPDNRYFVDVAQTHDTPPVSRLIDAHGTVVADLVASDLTLFNALGLRKAELFAYNAADGRTTLHGLIQFPSNFDPTKKYPVLSTASSS